MNTQANSAQKADDELLACTEPNCPKKDCRGAVGLHMHIQRAHKRNWSTRKKGT